MSMKNSNDAIGNRTRDLPVCSSSDKWNIISWRQTGSWDPRTLIPATNESNWLPSRSYRFNWEGKCNRPFLSVNMMVSQERPDPVAKKIATPAWNRASAIQSEPVKVLTELPSTFLKKFDVRVWNGFSWITVCAVILHTLMNQLHFIRRADFLDTMNNHKLFKNIMHVVFSRNISLHVVCVCERV